jgi:predicted acetyltransferase
MPQILYPNELQSSELVLEYLEYALHPFLGVPSWSFRMVDPQSSAYTGRINLRVGHSDLLERYAGHIGYSVDPDFRGHHYAAQAVEMLKPLAYRLGLDPLWITCDPDNAASRRTCERAGGLLVDIVEVPPDSPMWAAGARVKCRYRFDLA